MYKIDVQFLIITYNHRSTSRLEVLGAEIIVINFQSITFGLKQVPCMT